MVTLLTKQQKYRLMEILQSYLLIFDYDEEKPWEGKHYMLNEQQQQYGFVLPIQEVGDIICWSVFDKHYTRAYKAWCHCINVSDAEKSQIKSIYDELIENGFFVLTKSKRAVRLSPHIVEALTSWCYKPFNELTDDELILNLRKKGIVKYSNGRGDFSTCLEARYSDGFLVVDYSDYGGTTFEHLYNDKYELIKSEEVI